MDNLVGEIIVGLTSGLTEMATGLGTGISSLVEGIFVTQGTSGMELTTFGSVIVVFAGVSLAIGLSRWVLNFCTSLGARNR